MERAVKAPIGWLGDGATRLDASFYAGEGQLEARSFVHSKLKKVPLYSLVIGEHTGIFIPSRFKRVYVESNEFGFPYITGSGIVQSDPRLACRYISRKYTKSAEHLALRPGTIVVTCSGNIGNLVYLPEFLDGCVGSPDLIRIIPDPEKVLPGFLYAFLATKIGKALIIQHTYGSVIQHIEAHHIHELSVPILSKQVMEEVHEMVSGAADLMSKANRTLRELVTRIEGQYSPPNSQSKRKLAFSVSSHRFYASDNFTEEKRLEADFYLPDYERLQQYLDQECGSVLLGDIIESITRSGLRARVFVSDGVPMYTGQDLELLRPSDDKQLSRKLTRNIERDITCDGDIIMSCAGTVGKVELCHHNFYTGIFASDKLIRVRPNPELIHPGYLFAFLKSSLGQRQLLKHKTGSVIEWIRENHVASVRVPIPEDNGEEIGAKAFEACGERQRSLELEREAINIVEHQVYSALGKFTRR